MRHSNKLFLFLAGFGSAVTACSSDRATEGLTSIVQGSAPELIENRAIAGPYRPIYVFYSASAPLDRLSQAFGDNVRSATELGSRRIIQLKVPLASLDAVAGRVRALSWVNKVDAPIEGTRQADLRVAHFRAGIPARSSMMSEVTPWGIRDSRATSVDSAFSDEGSGIKVAVIDGGIDCTTQSDLSVVGGHDYIGTGYCADTNSNVVGGVHEGHGTLVAGIIAANVNGSGVRGMAPAVSLYSVSVCNDVSCVNGDIAQGIDWARTNGMNVVNISLAACNFASSDTMVTDAITNAWNAGVFVAIASSVNQSSGCGMNPLANAVGATPVGGMDSTYNYVPFGIYSSAFIAVSASARYVLTDKNGGGTVIDSGISLAVPHVAGAAALVMARGFNANNAYQLIRAEAHPRGTGHPNNFFGYGSLDAFAAAQPTPQVYSFTSSACSAHVIYHFHADPCDVTAVVTYGFTPFTYYWHFTYGSSAHADIYDTTTTASHTFPVPSPAGSSYWIDLAVTVSDAVSGRTRMSGESDDSWVVCPDSALLRQRKVPTSAGTAGGARPPNASPSRPSFQTPPPPPQICP